MGTEDFRAAEVAMSFARALAKGDFDAAYRLLAPSLRDDLSLSDLRSHYEQMTSYWNAPADSVELRSVDNEGVDWPGKDEHDMAWAFIAIDSLACSGLEAINVRVVREAGRCFVGEIVWGRP